MSGRARFVLIALLALALGFAAARATAVRHVIVGGSNGRGCFVHPIGFTIAATSDGRMRLQCGEKAEEHGIEFLCLCGLSGPARANGTDGGTE